MRPWMGEWSCNSLYMRVIVFEVETGWCAFWDKGSTDTRVSLGPFRDRSELLEHLHHELSRLCDDRDPEPQPYCANCMTTGDEDNPVKDGLCADCKTERQHLADQAIKPVDPDHLYEVTKDA